MLEGGFEAQDFLQRMTLQPSTAARLYVTSSSIVQPWECGLSCISWHYWQVSFRENIVTVCSGGQSNVFSCHVHEYALVIGLYCPFDDFGRRTYFPILKLLFRVISLWRYFFESDALCFCHSFTNLLVISFSTLSLLYCAYTSISLSFLSHFWQWSGSTGCRAVSGCAGSVKTTCCEAKASFHTPHHCACYSCHLKPACSF